MKYRKSFTIASFLVILFVSAGQTRSASAQNPTPSDDEVNRIAHQLYCPVCENTPLDVCPTEACRQWRDLIRMQLSQGRTENEIKQYFVQQYGARVLAEPPAAGFNWLVYVLPPVIILMGAIFLLSAMKAWAKPHAISVATSSSANKKESVTKEVSKDEYITRLEDELKKRK